VGQGLPWQEIIADWRKQIRFTTRIFRARGLHLDDRHIEHEDGRGFAATIADLVLYCQQPPGAARSGALGRPAMPKIQTVAEAAYWALLLDTLEDHSGSSAAASSGTCWWNRLTRASS
jgi:malate synthase